MNSPAIIAHRGASRDAPENTLAAIRLAWTQGADALEIDVQLTKDGKIATIHDKDTTRTTGVSLSVADSTFADLGKLDAGKWKDAKYAGERIPALEEVLAEMPAGKRLYIEIKDGPHIIAPLRAALSGTDPRTVTLICFDHPLLRAAKKAMPDFEAFALARFQVNKKSGFGPLTTEALIRLCQDSGFQGVDLDRYWPLNAKELRKLKAAGLKCCIWTVNDAAAARRLASAGVDALTTDRPQWLRKQLALPGPPFFPYLEAFWTHMASRMP